MTKTQCAGRLPEKLDVLGVGVLIKGAATASPRPYSCTRVPDRHREGEGAISRRSRTLRQREVGRARLVQFTSG
jgi:hypothetical protein